MYRFIGIITILISFSALAQDQPKQVVAKFFKEFSEKGTEMVIEKFYPVNVWGENTDTEVLRFKSRLEEVSPSKVGKYISDALVDEDQVIDSYLRLTYKVLFERQTVQMIFSLYRQEDKWVISDLDINKYIYDHEK